MEKYMELSVKIVEGSYENIKITTPEDLDVAKVFFKKKFIIPIDIVGI